MIGISSSRAPAALRDADGMAATYADDAVLTAATGEGAEGQQAIRDYWDITMPDGTSIPATGKSFAVSGVETARLRDGKLVGHNVYWDTVGMMSQLGLLPS